MKVESVLRNNSDIANTELQRGTLLISRDSGVVIVFHSYEGANNMDVKGCVVNVGVSGEDIGNFKAFTAKYFSPLQGSVTLFNS